MDPLIKINELLQKLQAETPNCGGHYHFTKIDLPDKQDIYKSVKDYMLRFKEYQYPFYTDDKTAEKIYLKWRDPENLELKENNSFENLLREKLEYWSNHRTTLDCRDSITPLYKGYEMEFKDVLKSFLLSETILKIYEVKFVDTSYCFGHDHANDDTLIKTKNGYYILHFGWSS